MSGNKSNKWKKVGGRSRSANYNAVRIPQQTANIFNISDLMGKASTDNSTLGKINIHDNVAIQGTLDVSGSATGVTSTKTSGNEFATLDWVNGELNPTTLWTLHENGNIIYNKNGTQVDIIGNSYNEGTSTFNGSLQVTSPFVKETSFFGLTNDTEDQSQPPNFGSSVAISNMIDSSYNIAVTSAQQAEVYYTDPSGDSSTLGAKIDKINDISFNNDTMGFVGSNQSIAISADGKIVVVGDPSNNRIFISTTNTDGSKEIVTISTDDNNVSFQANSLFGYSVSISSDGYSIAVGAPHFKNEDGIEIGQVYVWKGVYSNPNNIQWLYDVTYPGMIGDNGGDSDIIPRMGISVAFNYNGRLLAVGSAMIDTDTNTNELINDHTHDDGKPDQYKGQVDVYKYTFSNSNVNWLKLPQSLTVDNYSHFGKSISISDDGTILAVGAPGQITDGVLHSGEAGNVYIYQIDGITASQIAEVYYQSVSNVTWKKIKTIPGKPHSSFGTSVSLNLAGDTLVAGGPTYDGSVIGTGLGYVEVYTYVHSDWRLACPTIYQEFPSDGRTYIPNTSARFGSSVSISSNDSSNNMIVVGAPYNQLVTDGNSSGSDENYGTIFTYILKDIVQSNLFSVDGGSKTTSFKGNVYIDRTGITSEPSGNEVVTADWVNSKLNNTQQIISQQGLIVDNMKSSSSLTASDQTKIDKLAKKIDITQQMINYHAQNVTNIKLNATSKMAIDELTRKLSSVQEVIDKQNEDIYNVSLQTRSNEEYIIKQNEDIYKMSLQTRSNEESIFNYEMKYNDTMKKQANLINDTQMRIRSQEKQVKGLCRNVNSHSTNIQSMKQMIMSGGSSGPTIPK